MNVYTTSTELKNYPHSKSYAIELYTLVLYSTVYFKFEVFVFIIK